MSVASATTRAVIPREPALEVADAALVSRMTQGDRSALAELYNRHVHTLLGLAHGILRDRQEAEDVIHDVFLEAWRHCADYSQARSSVRTWLLMRTRCRTLDRLRSKGRRNAVATHAVAAHTEARAEAADMLLDDGHRLPAALAQMPESQQHVIRLAYFEGLSTLEISSRLGIPTGTVKSRTHAAIKTLRSVLGIADE